MKIHFIAIGGSAMHNLAIALQKNGHNISGSDDEIFEPSRSRLSHYGLLPEKVGWYPDKLSPDTDVVILGMHARADNPELARARALGLQIFSYPEYLYQHAKNKQRIVIAGSHGKTTITGMVMHVLKKLGHHFDYMVGSKLKDFEVMVQLSEEAPMMIFEGDEYLTSPIDRRPKFHWYKPHIALITGIAWDHINVFPTFDNYVEQFRIFINLIAENGTLIYNSRDKVLSELIGEKQLALRLLPYAVPDHEIIEGTTFLKSKNETRFPLKVFGTHNLMNANGARMICNVLGVSDQDFYTAIESFEGTSNRLELLNRRGNNWFYRDFAHAPSKVAATVDAVRKQFPKHTFIVCFELHTFSSLTGAFLKEYAGSLNPADEACVYFNPHALKMKRLPELDTRTVKEAFDYEKLTIFVDAEKMVKWMAEQNGDNKVYLCMSSGNFDGTDLFRLSNNLL